MGFGGQGLVEAGSEGLVLSKEDLGCRDPTGQDLGNSGTQRGRFGQTPREARGYLFMEQREFP